jgi:hypothetical protein
MNPIIKIGIVGAVLLSAVVIFATIHTQSLDSECKKLGGVLVRGAGLSEPACVKAVR